VIEMWCVVPDQAEEVRHRALKLDSPFEGLVSMNHVEEEVFP
jgi:hypothetical protein